MGIDTYLTTVFWIGIIGGVLKLLIMAMSEYPRKQEVNLGMDVVTLIIAIFFFVWVCYLRFYA